MIQKGKQGRKSSTKTHPVEANDMDQLSRFQSSDQLLIKKEAEKNKSIRKEAENPLRVKQSFKHLNSSKNKRRKLRHWVILPEDKRKILWDFLMLFIMVYVLFEVPYSICLDLDVNLMMGHPAEIISLIADCFFISDIIVTFFTAYRELNVYKPVTDRRLIARRYLRTWFLVDVITSVPAGPLMLIFHTHKSLTKLPKVIRVLKIARLMKIARVLAVLTQWHEESSSMLLGLMEAAKFLFISFFLAHLSGCLFIGIASYERQDQTEYLPDSWISRYDLNHAEAFQKYFLALYWAVTTLSTVGYGDIAPVTDLEIGLTIIVMLMGTALFGYIIGNAATLMASSHQSAVELREKIVRVSNFMAQRRLPEEMRRRIRSHFEYSWRRSQVYDEEGILRDLPWTLRTEVLLHIHEETIATVPLLQSIGMDAVTMLSVHFKPMLACPDDVVIHEGFYGQEMYICVEGVLQELAGYNMMELASSSSLQKQSNLVVELRRFGKGDYFAEYSITLDEAHKHPATIKAVELCDLFTISRSHFASVGKAFPHIYKTVQEQCGQRYDKILKDIDKTIRGARFKMPDGIKLKINTDVMEREETKQPLSGPYSTTTAAPNTKESARIGELLRRNTTESKRRASTEPPKQAPPPRRAQQCVVDFVCTDSSGGSCTSSQDELYSSWKKARHNRRTAKYQLSSESSKTTSQDTTSARQQESSRYNSSRDNLSSSRAKYSVPTISSLGNSTNSQTHGSSGSEGTSHSTATRRKNNSRLAEKYQQYQMSTRSQRPPPPKQTFPVNNFPPKTKHNGIVYQISSSDEGEKETPRLNPLSLSGSFHGLPNLGNSFRGKAGVKLLDHLATTVEGSQESSTRYNKLDTIESSFSHMSHTSHTLSRRNSFNRRNLETILTTSLDKDPSQETDVMHSTGLDVRSTARSRLSTADFQEWGRLLPNGVPASGQKKYKIYRKILTWKTIAQVKARTHSPKKDKDAAEKVPLLKIERQESIPDESEKAPPKSPNKLKPKPPPPKLHPLGSKGSPGKKPVPPPPKKPAPLKPAAPSTMGLEQLSPISKKPLTAAPLSRSRENSKNRNLRSRENSKNRSRLRSRDRPQRERKKAIMISLDDMQFQLNRLTDAQRGFEERQIRIENLLLQILDRQPEQPDMKLKKSL